MIVDKSSNEHHLKKKEVIVANQSAWAMLEGWAYSSMRSLVLKKCNDKKFKQVSAQTRVNIPLQSLRATLTPANWTFAYSKIQ